MSSSSYERLLDVELLRPFNHILQVRGKLLRKKIPLAFNYWLKVPEDKLKEAIEVTLEIHNATLLIDDIQDNTLLRRTIPAAHVIYGIPLTVNTALHILIGVIFKLLHLGQMEAVKVYIENAIAMIYGQGIDIYWRDNHICPNEAEYIIMAKKKTGNMFNMSVRMMQLFSDNKTDYTHLALLFGLYFQIRDDYCNLKQIETSKEEQFCEDITEGKFSWPMIHALQFPEGKPLLNILKQRTRDKCMKKYCLTILEKLGSMEYTRKTLMALHREVEAEIARLGGNPEMDELMHEMLKWKD